jgi:hypothetical protein
VLEEEHRRAEDHSLSFVAPVASAQDLSFGFQGGASVGAVTPAAPSSAPFADRSFALAWRLSGKIDPSWEP